MSDQLRSALLAELQWQCNAAHDAIGSLNGSLAAQNLVSILRNAYSFLYHAHLIYRLISDDVLRNDFQQYIDKNIAKQISIVDIISDPQAAYRKWDSESVRHNLFVNILAPPGAISGMGEEDTFRLYDPSSHSLVFRGERANIQEIANWIGGLAAAVSAVTSRG